MIEINGFSIMWFLTIIIFIYTTYRFIVLRGIGETITRSFPIIICFVIVNLLSSDMIGKTKFDSALEIIAISWYILMPSVLSTLWLSIENKILSVN